MEAFIGSIMLVAFNYNPKGWFACDGSILKIKDHQPLFALLGCSFGGDGRETFALPKLDSPQKGLHYIICDQGYWPDRDW